VAGYEVFGRERLTGDPADRYRFRTPSLRNVALTVPWGHTGAFATLEAVVQHHLDPLASLYGYDTQQAALPPRPDLDALDFLAHNDSAVLSSIDAANERAPMQLSPKKLADLMAFRRALTDTASLDLRADVPTRVPSGPTLAE